MATAQVRHDVAVQKLRIGRIIGTRGIVLRALIERSGCEVFVLDKEGAPPGWLADQRLVVLLGRVEQIKGALALIQVVRC